MNDDEMNKLESLMLRSWDELEAMLEKQRDKNSEYIYQQVLDLIRELRACGYDQWCNASVLLNNIRFIRGNAAVFMVIHFERESLTAMGIIRENKDISHQFEFELKPICMTSEVQVLFEQLMLEPLERTANND